MNLSKLPTSPDGTDWGIYGDTPSEQWAGVLMAAEMEDAMADYFPRYRVVHHEIQARRKMSETK